MEIKTENIIKARLAENLAEAILKKSGNKVYPLGLKFFRDMGQIEDFLPEQNLVRKKITSIPDFFVLTKNKKPLFIEVKFRTDPEALEEELLLEKDILEGFWKARIIMITPKEPHFRLLVPPYFETIKERRLAGSGLSLAVNRKRCFIGR